MSEPADHPDFGNPTDWEPRSRAARGETVIAAWEHFRGLMRNVLPGDESALVFAREHQSAADQPARVLSRENVRARAALPVPVEGIEPGQVWAHHGNEHWTVRALEGGKVLIDPSGEGVAIRVWPDYFQENFTRVESVPVEGEADR